MDLPSATARKGDLAKRLLDVAASTALSLLALPVIVILAGAVCVSLRTRRPFFRQQRVGRGGVPFTLWKLRTLPESAPRQADKYALAGVPITRFARFLRHTHLDELPQIFHVVSGRMSLVGPRPEMPWLLARFEPGFVSARLLVRPGCTGLWQISPHAAQLIGEAPQYDLLYLQHRSVRLDLWVLWRTVLVSIDDARAVSLGHAPAWVRGAVPGTAVPQQVTPRPGDDERVHEDWRTTPPPARRLARQ